MNLIARQLKYSRSTLIFTVLGGLAVIFPFPIIFGVAVTITYLISNGLALGGFAFPKENTFWKAFLGTLGYISILTVLGSIIYYVYALNTVSVAVLVVLLPFLIGWLKLQRTVEKKEVHPKLPHAHSPRNTAASFLIGTLLFVLTGYGFVLLMQAATTAAIRSPWDTVPRLFFIVVFLLALLSITAAYSKLVSIAMLGLSALGLLTISVAAIVYSVGFGFDPFIHQATESIILSVGSISPKPFYYIGQYTIVTLLARMTGLGIALIDTHLMAIVFVSMTACVYFGLRKTFSLRRETAALASFGTLALPLASFAATTPQGLANAVLIATVMMGIAWTKGAVPYWFIVLLTLTTAVIHPLAGIPLGIFIVILTYLKIADDRAFGTLTKNGILIALIILGSLTLPAMFALNSAVSSAATVTVDTQALSEPFSLLALFKGPEIETRQFSAILDVVYTWRAVRTLIILALGGIGLWLMRKRASIAAMTIFSGALAFLLNYVLLRSVVHFPFLIEYERASYANRMFDLTLFLLLPAVLYALARAFMRVRKNGTPTLGIFVTLLLATILTSSVYLGFPRRDQYESSRGWSTSAPDISAVMHIDSDAGDAPYIVLANQSVSAAAIRELGFKQYFHSTDDANPEDMFYYPIPTGGSLYAFFLEANEQLGERKVIEDAMNLAGVDTAYYVVNHYWWDAGRITTVARTESDAWWNIENRVWIFKYTR